MIATESSMIKWTGNVVFLGLVVVLAISFVFRAELSDTVFDGLASNDAADQRKWVAGSGGKFVLRPERNDPLFLRIDGLRLGSATSLGVPVSFDITNLGDANDFPNITVVMTDAGGYPLRQIVFSSRDYVHDSRFGKQHVELLLQPRPGEQGCTVRVDYGASP